MGLVRGSVSWCLLSSVLAHADTVLALSLLMKGMTSEMLGEIPCFTKLGKKRKLRSTAVTLRPSSLSQGSFFPDVQFYLG